MCGNGGLPCADVLECWICWLLAATPMFLPTNCAMYFVSITIECDQTICASIVVYARYQTAMIFVYIYICIYIYTWSASPQRPTNLIVHWYLDTLQNTCISIYIYIHILPYSLNVLWWLDLFGSDQYFELWSWQVWLEFQRHRARTLGCLFLSLPVK